VVRIEWPEGVSLLESAYEGSNNPFSEM
jgi:hypothetical protein